MYHIPVLLHECIEGLNIKPNGTYVDVTFGGGGHSGEILRHLGISKIRLITNNPVKRVGLESYGLEIVENIPVIIEPNVYNRRYLETKRTRMGHKL